MRCPTPCNLVDILQENFPPCFVHSHEIPIGDLWITQRRWRNWSLTCWWWILLLRLQGFDDASLNIFYITIISCWGGVVPRCYFKAFQVFLRLDISSVILPCMASLLLIFSWGMDSRLELCTLNWCCLTCDIYSVGNCYPQVLFLKLNCEEILCCWLNLGVFVFAWVIAL